MDPLKRPPTRVHRRSVFAPAAKPLRSAMGRRPEANARHPPLAHFPNPATSGHEEIDLGPRDRPQEQSQIPTAKTSSRERAKGRRKRCRPNLKRAQGWPLRASSQAGPSLNPPLQSPHRSQRQVWRQESAPGRSPQKLTSHPLTWNPGDGRPPTPPRLSLGNPEGDLPQPGSHRSKTTTPSKRATFTPSRPKDGASSSGDSEPPSARTHRRYPP